MKEQNKIDRQRRDKDLFFLFLQLKLTIKDISSKESENWRKYSSKVAVQSSG